MYCWEGGRSIRKAGSGGGRGRIFMFQRRLEKELQTGSIKRPEERVDLKKKGKGSRRRKCRSWKLEISLVHADAFKHFRCSPFPL